MCVLMYVMCAAGLFFFFNTNPTCHDDLMSLTGCVGSAARLRNCSVCRHVRGEYRPAVASCSSSIASVKARGCEAREHKTRSRCNPAASAKIPPHQWTGTQHGNF